MRVIKFKYSQGFTLVEMMVAMTISLILLLGVSQIFTSNKRSSQVTEGLARVQENARYALKKISADMRRAGYVGCANINLFNHLDTTHTDYDADLFDPSNGTAGWDYSIAAAPATSATEPGQTYNLATVTPSAAGDAAKWQNDTAEGLPATLAGKVAPGSDVIALKWMSDNINNIPLNAAVIPASASVETLSPHGIADGTMLIISDCSGGDIFQHISSGSTTHVERNIASGTLTPGNVDPTTTTWAHSYPIGANINAFMSRAYYIGKGASGEPSLYSITYVQAAGGQVTEEIAEGIENMQVLYGLDTNADNLAEKYVTAGQVVPNHANVVSLKIALIARSPNPAKKIEEAKSLNLLGTTITIPADRKIRFVFSSTIKLRNKGVK